MSTVMCPPDAPAADAKFPSGLTGGDGPVSLLIEKVLRMSAQLAGSYADEVERRRNASALVFNNTD